MSERTEDNDRAETTVTPVRRPSFAGDAFDGAAAPRRGRGPLVAAVVAVLLLVMIAVFGYLPNRVEQEREREAAVTEQIVPEVTEPAPPPLTREEREALREQAEDMLAQLLEQRQELDARSASSWGAETWVDYESASDLADDALLADELTEAVAQYELALEAGEALFRRSQEIMTSALAAGEAAIEAGNPDLAQNQFALVLTVDPDNRRGQAGLDRAENLPAVLDAMRRGDTATQGGQLDAAADAYRGALAVDPNWEPARAALQSVTARIAENRFDALITEGFTALDGQRFDAAVAAFDQAVAMRPGSDVARDGLAQAEQGRLLNSILMAEVRGQAFERRELWTEAMARYREALETDPTLTFAIEGMDRAQRRADLAAKLDALIETPNRLLNEDALEDARGVLAEALAIDDPGPVHQTQIDRLSSLIELASAPVSVTLVSDDATEVTLYRIGELGTFTTREIELKPGQYTAVGSRRGYRDVRESFTVLPGRDNGPVTVICVESI